MGKVKLHSLEVKVTFRIPEEYLKKYFNNPTSEQDLELVNSLRVKSSIPGIGIYNVEPLNNES